MGVRKVRAYRGVRPRVQRLAHNLLATDRPGFNARIPLVPVSGWPVEGCACIERVRGEGYITFTDAPEDWNRTGPIPQETGGVAGEGATLDIEKVRELIGDKFADWPVGKCAVNDGAVGASSGCRPKESFVPHRWLLRVPVWARTDSRIDGKEGVLELEYKRGMPRRERWAEMRLVASRMC